MALAKLNYAPDAWKHLNGILCIYKPERISMNACMLALRQRLCDDLNSMKTRPIQTVVELRRRLTSQETVKEPGKQVVTTVPDGDHTIEVVKAISYADHPNVIGPRYQIQDFHTGWVHGLAYRLSGVTLVGLNRGTTDNFRISCSKWIRTFIIQARFGIATQTTFDDGPILEKSTYHKITRSMLDRILGSIQASQQRYMFQTSGVPLESSRAYELASRGLVRPENESNPVIYSVKCVHFDLPHFHIEIKTINETPEYLGGFIHDLGLKLHSVASCSKIRCIQHGPFGLQHALLSKHWGVENVIQNVLDNSAILRDFDLRMRDPLVRIAPAPGSKPIEPPPTEVDVESITPDPVEIDTYNNFVDTYKF